MAETSKYSIIVSERATQMLLSHITFLSQVSLTAASKLVQDFDTQIQSLEFMPMRRPFFNADYISAKYLSFYFDRKKIYDSFPNQRLHCFCGLCFGLPSGLFLVDLNLEFSSIQYL